MSGGDFGVDIYVLECSNCKTRFENEFSNSDMATNFILFLKCMTDGKLYCVDTMSDNVFKKIYNEIKMKSTEEVILESRAFKEKFESICKPCSCGGNYIFDYAYVCPKCGNASKQNFVLINKYSSSIYVQDVQYQDEYNIPDDIED